VLLAGAANFVGYFAFGLAVAKMIGNGVVSHRAGDPAAADATLLGAVLWKHPYVASGPANVQ